MSATLIRLATLPAIIAASSLLSADQHFVDCSAMEKEVVTTLAEGKKLISRTPVAFVPNFGQWEHPAKYVARIGGMTVFLEDNGWIFTMVKPSGRNDSPQQFAPSAGVAVRMTFAHGDASRLTPENRMPGVHHYMLGSDPEKWRSDVPLYGAVRYCKVHPGVDVLAREHEGHFEYDLMFAPDADLAAIEITVEGIDRMHIDGDALVLETALGPVRMAAPPSWEEGPSGETRPIPCRYVLLGEDRFGFEAPERHQDWGLVVDPGLVWSTFLGGFDAEQPSAVVVDEKGATTVTGWTYTGSFPTTPGALSTRFNGIPNTTLNIFVTRLSPSGSSLIYSTFLGGTFNEASNALALDEAGAVVVTGWTRSTDFPVTGGAFDTLFNGFPSAFFDVFVAKLSPSGASLDYSTYLGGTANDSATAIAIDTDGIATVVGWTESTNYPVTPDALDQSYNGGFSRADAFVARLSPTGSSLVYSTFLGGVDDDQAQGLAIDTQGRITIAGWTVSADFPVTANAFDSSYNGGRDAFIARLSPSGSSLTYATFLGGSKDDSAFALALDKQGNMTITGETGSADLPITAGAFDESYNGFGDAFVAQLSPTGSSLVYATFLGGQRTDRASALAIDAEGAATVAGETNFNNFPTTRGAFDTIPNGLNDAFVTRLSPSGSSLIYSTVLGSSRQDLATGLALGADGSATVVGWTISATFPTTVGAFDTGFSLAQDVFVSRLDMLPRGVSAFGNSSPGCDGLLAMSVNSMPALGNSEFAFTCGNAPANGVGRLALGAGRLDSPVDLFGASLWVDRNSAFLLLPASSNSIGASTFDLPIPAIPGLVGIELHAQFLWIGPTSPESCPLLGISASNALSFTIQL